MDSNHDFRASLQAAMVRENMSYIMSLWCEMNQVVMSGRVFCRRFEVINEQVVVVQAWNLVGKVGVDGSLALLYPKVAHALQIRVDVQ